MAITNTLPIYKVAYDLLSAVSDMVQNMPRSVKQSIGGKVSDECIEIIVLVFRANTARDKTPYLSDLLERLQVIELLIRLARDKRFIPTGKYAAAIALTDSIGKQATGWRKSAERLSHSGHGHHD